MGRKKFAKDPLLFIHQSNIRKPNAPMQSNYMSPKKSRELQQQEGAFAASNSKKSVKKNAFEMELDKSNHGVQEKELDKSNHGVQEKELLDTEEENEPSEIESEPDSKEEETVNEKAENPKFKDMTLEEKITYFVSTSDYAPKMKCIVKTDKKTYRGIITGTKDNDVTMRVGNRSSNMLIPIADIIEIKLLGF
ncbi:CotO family spore coat protein [Virgibacillus sp. C22-A2]|uniref:CotO family spore coat protein n=1 Tax=Virgibacillus tibetensis TaxID=3042313 RepID=A0ABU6KFB6_9BACI|nr:CotO family spore coat protein [Virgibacillus sp. C22-A2]